MKTLQTRITKIETYLAQDAHGETWQERIERFKQLAAQRIRFEDVRAIAVGQWDAVTSPILLVSKHRDRWEQAAPVILQIMKRQHEHLENAD